VFFGERQELLAAGLDWAAGLHIIQCIERDVAARWWLSLNVGFVKARKFLWGF
jgi:hypothetical protein